MPASYEEFLRVSNGWPIASLFTGPLWATQQVAWFRERHSAWIRAWSATPFPAIADSEYFVYGDEQRPEHLRVLHLETALEISEAGDGSIFLLNPDVTFAGEWEAWFFANWLPGAERYQSFTELIISCRRLLAVHP